MSFNFIATVTVHIDFGAQENKVFHCFYCFPIYMPRSDVTGCRDLGFLNGDFKPAFSHSSFTLIKSLFSSSSLSAISVVVSAYLRLLTFLLEILIPVCDSSSLAFHSVRQQQQQNRKLVRSRSLRKGNCTGWYTCYGLSEIQHFMECLLQSG